MQNKISGSRIYIYWGIVLFYLFLIFIMSSVPGYELPELGYKFSDKIVHFLEYGILGIFLYNAFRYASRTKRPFIWSISSGIFWGASDEFHQYFVPGRQCSFQDFLADASGILIFVTISKLLNDFSIKNSNVHK